MNKKSKNTDRPATQHDLEVWGGNLSARAEATEHRLDLMEDELKKHTRLFESIFGILESIQGQLKTMLHIPDNVERHEERITKLEVKVRLLQK
ncbi:MAG TPA: hypothetical protein VLG69_04085 [Candidatus Andersenbacteria bacterium]|nr:hypothetical protein [Candidatus Andersenbacteria bacterium]